jgi:hypothetical protein
LLTYPGAIFVDTFNRSLVGSESRDEDVAAYLNGVAEIQQKFACLTVLVHHCGIDESRMRGHTSLGAAADVQLAVKRLASGERQVSMKIERSKDGPEGIEILSKLKSYPLGFDPEGDEIATLIVEPLDDALAPPPVPKLTKNQQTMLSLLERAGPLGLSTDMWNDRAKQVGLGTRRPGDLWDYRDQLRRKRLVFPMAGEQERWVASKYVQNKMFDE